ncbi:MAG: hypothetical protein RR304_09575, partial [Bacteroides sp.]
MEDTTLQKYALMISFMLPEGMLDWFDVIRVEETDKEKSNNELDLLFHNVLHVYLDERDNRTSEYLGLIPNGFTEATVIHDYPVRNRKLVLHVRRRRYLDADKRNIILCNFPLSAEGTRLSVEFG